VGESLAVNVQQTCGHLLQGFVITGHFPFVNAEAKVIDGPSGQFKDVISDF
jgi:hypothetical protein